MTYRLWRVPVPQELRLAVFRLCTTQNPNDERLGRTALAKKLGIATSTIDEVLEIGGALREETIAKVRLAVEALEKAGA